VSNLEQHVYQLRQSVGMALSKNRELEAALGQEQGENSRSRLELERLRADLNNLSQAMSKLTAQGSGAPENVRYIEQIPGRRIPFDLMVNIPIGSGITSEQQASTTISQDGPFVAVARYATFQSALQYTVTDTETSNVAAFQGRSFGRFRPIHSAWDINDGSPQYQPTVGQAFPGTGGAILAAPSNHSSFRSMEFDGIIRFQNQGSAFQRQNVGLPSAFYSQQINAAFNLGALDFFERGEVLEWRVTPLHSNNPNFGNASAYAVGGVYPFLASQYDVHEGIVDPVVALQTTDPVVRLPEGILTIGFHGYRIVQPPGLVSLI
jgi:hypothetical protein